MSDLSRLFASMANVFKAVPQDKLDDLADTLEKADGSRAEPRPWKGVAASGNGAERTTAQSSLDADHGDNMMRLYSSLADLMTQQMKRQDDVEKAMRSVAKTLATLMGKAVPSDGEDEADSDEGNTDQVRHPDWEANGAKHGKNPDGEIDEVEKGAAHGNIASKSLSELFAGLHADAGTVSRGTGRVGLTPPPTMQPVAKANHDFGITDAQIEAMSAADAVEALAERQRRRYEAMTGAKLMRRIK